MSVVGFSIAEGTSCEDIALVFASHQLRALLGEDRGLLIQDIQEQAEWGVKIVEAAGLLR
ncbi:hypothetical protein RYB01_25110 [Pseudomonas syringae]|nr:hypothetical protein [Pseudomonas syringae]